MADSNPKEEGNEEVLTGRHKLQAAIESESVPRFYANGFTNFGGNADMGILLENVGQPIAIVNMSLNLAKTLHEKLGEMIDDYEQSMEQTILTTQEIEKSRSKS